jgi:hypothetical protein
MMVIILFAPCQHIPRHPNHVRQKESLDREQPMKTPKLYRHINRMLGPVFPEAMGRLAADVLLTPRPPRQSLPFMDAERSIDLGGGAQAWVYGRGPAVFLLHGWSSGPAALESLMPSLVVMGFQAVCVRAPGHDPSDPGESHPAAFVNVLLRARDALGTPAAVVGHSMGAASALVAQAEGLQARCLVLISGPAPCSGVLERFIRDAGLPAQAAQACRQRVIQLGGKPEDFFDIQRFAHDVEANVLLVHDRDDAKVPFAEATELNDVLPRSRLFVTTALGHRRILKDRRVLTEVSLFLAEHARTPQLPPVSRDARFREPAPQLA